MGEFLFVPLYKYLRDKGVIFKFFHKLDKLVVSPDGSAIQSVVLGRQWTFAIQMANIAH